MKKLIICTSIIFWSCFGFAKDANHYNPKFQQGTKLLLGDQPNEAIAIFNQLNWNRVKSPELFNNLANAYFKQEQYGKAIAFYEKALLLAPLDTQLTHNKQVALARLNHIPIKKGILTGTITPKMIDRLLLIVAMFMLISGLSFFVSSVIVPRRWQLLVKANSLNLLITSASIFVVLSVIMLYNQSGEYAVITSTSAVTHVGPSNLAKKVGRFSEGDYIAIETFYKGWYKTKTPAGGIAWINFKDVEPIN